MVAAKWSLEASRSDAGLQILDETSGQAQGLVSNLVRMAGHGKPTIPEYASPSPLLQPACECAAL
jgi:hypothetical protein